MLLASSMNFQTFTTHHSSGAIRLMLILFTYFVLICYKVYIYLADYINMFATRR